MILQKLCEKHQIELEYTAPYTPQMTVGVVGVERHKAVLLNSARAFSYSVKFTDDNRKKLLAEAAS